MGTYILQLSATGIYAITVNASGMIVIPPAGLKLADGSYELRDVATGNPHLGFDMKDGKQMGTVYGLKTNQIVVLPADDTVVLSKGMTLADGVYTVQPYGTFEVRDGKPGKLRLYGDPDSDGLNLLGLITALMLSRRRRGPPITLEAYVSELSHIEESIAIVEQKPCPEHGVTHPLAYMWGGTGGMAGFIEHIKDEIRGLQSCPFGMLLPSFIEGSESNAKRAGFPNKAHVPNLIERRDHVLAWKPPIAPAAEPGGESTTQ